MFYKSKTQIPGSFTLVLNVQQFFLTCCITPLIVTFKIFSNFQEIFMGTKTNLAKFFKYLGLVIDVINCERGYTYYEEMIKKIMFLR